MTVVSVKLRRVGNRGEALPLPRYQTAGAAGADLLADLTESLTLKPGERALVPTGLALDVPFGYEAQVRARSGLAVKHGIALTNGIGTIDSDYRGEVQVAVINLGKEPVVFQRGERIAQLVIAPVVQAQFVEVEALADSERGAGGFGSTGK